MVTKTEAKERSIIQEPKFIDPEKLSKEQLTNPDYRLKQLAKLNRGKLNFTCSRCHYCR